MLRKIKLYGYLKEKYGDEYLLAVDTPAEAVRALGVQLPGFKELVRKGEFHVLIGDKKIDETELTITAGTIDTIHFVPLAVGSKDDGILKVILGVVLIGVGFAVGAGAIAGTFAATFSNQLIVMGAGMLLNGIGQMLSPTPDSGGNEPVDTKQSYMFGNPQNVTEEGNIIPCAYGTPWCGSLVISAGLDVKEVI